MHRPGVPQKSVSCIGNSIPYIVSLARAMHGITGAAADNLKPVASNVGRSTLTWRCLVFVDGLYAGSFDGHGGLAADVGCALRFYEIARKKLLYWHAETARRCRHA